MTAVFVAGKRTIPERDRSLAERVVVELADEVEVLRSAIRTVDGTMVGDFFAMYLSPIELAAVRRALNDRSNPEGDR